MSLFHLRLRAQDTEKNRDRDYEIFVSKILFGFLGLTIAFGRHGARGSFKNYIFETKEEAQRFVHKILQKRLTAPQRIGCSYRLVSAYISKEETSSLWMMPQHQNAFGNSEVSDGQ